MHDIISYLLKSILCSGILMAYYWFFLRNKQLHQYNRIFLILTVLLSAMFPLLHFEWYQVTATPATLKYEMLEVMQSVDEEIVVEDVADPPVSIGLMSGLLYSIVSLIIMVMPVKKLAWLWKIKRSHNRDKVNGYNFINTTLSNAPFSFFNDIFWKDGIDLESDEGQRILAHELVHIEQKHSVDKLFMQMALILFWINPFYWLLSRELSITHEFIADEKAIDKGDTESFARMLLQTHYGIVYPDIVHPFFNSSTKRRLQMLNQTKPRFTYLRRLMALPLLTAAIFLFSFKVNETNITRARKTILLALDAGHGGVDNGAIGIDGIKEKDLSLKITQRIAALGEKYNIDVVLLRPDDKYVKLEDRAAKSNALSADLLLSIHVNQQEAAETAFDGFDIILGKNSSYYSQSREFGSVISAHLNSFDIKTRMMDKGLHVLHHANAPAVLIECGYVNNREDVARINNQANLDKLCHSILSGIVTFANAK